MTDAAIAIFRRVTGTTRPPNDNEASCVICDKPVKLGPKTAMVWVHMGDNHIVTPEEGRRLDESGQAGASLGYQPVGSDCLRRNPALKPYVVRLSELS